MERQPPGPASSPPLPHAPKAGDGDLESFLEISADAHSAARKPRAPTERHIMEVLENSKARLTIPALADKSGVGFLELSESVESLAVAGVVVVTGPPGSEVVALVQEEGEE